MKTDTFLQCTGSVFLRCLIFLIAFATSSFGKSYVIDKIEFPEDMPPEVGAVKFDKNGDLYVALRRGDILKCTPNKDPKKFKWRVFATGFHNACGMEVIEPGHIIISQMAELTEVIDSDKDGIADEYNKLSSEYGLSGNYHETVAICPDGEGGLFLAPGTASHNGPTFETPLGEYSKVGRYGRNYSSVQWRGWVLHRSKDGTITPYASGFRMHNGLTLSPEGDLWVGDNQGDWKAASPLYHVTKDTFFGHPSSLVWDKRFDSFENPLYMPRILLDDLFNKPAFHMPHNMMRSCSEPVVDNTNGKFGPFSGQILVPDNASTNMMRCMPEMIDGAWQGAATYFSYEQGLIPGGNRAVMSPEGDTLYIGLTSRGWQAVNEGLQRIRYTGTMPFHVLNCELTYDGFKLSFTKDIDISSVKTENIKIERYRYEYGYHYGSGKVDRGKIEFDITEGKTENVFHLNVQDLVPNFIYHIDMKNIKSKNGDVYNSDPVAYTLNRLKRPASDHSVSVTELDDRLRIEVDGKLFTEYLMKGHKSPLLYPIMNNNGTPMTRDYPINKASKRVEEKDHPHHVSLWIGHQGINGADFWHNQEKTQATVEHQRLIETRSGEDRALIKTFNLWKGYNGKPLCSDTRELKFGVINGARYIDIELNMHASHGDLVMEEWKDGFVAIRTHPDLRLSPGRKGKPEEVFGNAKNSQGISGKKVWGKRANWVHYWGKVEGEDSGIAILNHPSNPRSPVWWHARDYGLVSANPFAKKSDDGDGELVIPYGQTLTLKYRFIFHGSSKEESDIEAQYDAYIYEPITPRTITQNIPDGVLGAYKK